MVKNQMVNPENTDLLEIMGHFFWEYHGNIMFLNRFAIFWVV